MYLPDTAFLGTYDPQLVTLSILIAVVVSYAALNLAGRAVGSQGFVQRVWLLGGATTLGFGIWAMHFVGMLAFSVPGMPVRYDLPTTLISMVPIVAASGLALFLVSRPRISFSRLTTGALVLGAGISAMHYLGMDSMRMGATVHYQPWLLAASIGTAITASFFALGSAFRLRSQRPHRGGLRLAVSALMLGIAIAGMHYLGMAAVIIVPDGMPMTDDSGASSGSLAAIIALAAMLPVAVALVTASFDRKMAETAREHAELLKDARNAMEQRVHDRTADLRAINHRLRLDIAARRGAENALHQEKERALVTLHSIGDAVITTDAAGVIDYMNPVAESFTHYTAAQARGRFLKEVFHTIDEVSRTPLDDPAERCLREQSPIGRNGHKLLTRPDGTEIAIEDSAAPIRDRRGQVTGVVLVFNDVSEARLLAHELSWQATHDPLTGLVNRAEFERRLDTALGVLDEHRHHALCYLDLDQFKVVNDTCGHVAGDELLRQLTLLLQKTIRERDTLARLGGDEFGVLLEGCTLENALHIAEELRQTVREFRFTWQDKSFEVGVSIGLVPIDAAGPGRSELLSAADVACYAAKDMGRNRVHVYQPDDEELAQRHGEMQWIARISEAFEQNRFRLYRQSIVPLQTDHDHPIHYEVLIRMIDIHGHLIPPGAFIPAAERYNLMPTIDRWVIRQTFAHFATHCRDSYAQHPCVFAINLSGGSLGDEHLLDFIRDRLNENEIPPEAVCFEITETAAISNFTHANRLIGELKRLGCRFALDDFGAGLSSFAYLKNLPVDYLKIDGAFVRDMVRDPMDRAIVEAVNEIGHVMGIATIGEFVEDEETLSLLRSLGVDYGQGFGIERPVPLEEMLPNAVRVMNAG